MTLFFGFFGSRKLDNPSRRKFEKPRRLRFESLEDRRLLSITPLSEGNSFVPSMIANSEVPAIGETYVVDKSQSQTVFGVTYAIAEKDTGSLTLTVGEENAISIIKNSTGTVTKIFVSGSYSATGTGYIIDETAIATDITAALPYYFKKVSGTININEGAVISQSCAGFTGTAITVNVNNGGHAEFRCVASSETGKYYNAATTITVKAGGTAAGFSNFGNKATVINISGGTLNWTGNNTAADSLGFIKSFNVTGGSAILADGTCTLSAVTGGSVTLNGAVLLPSLTVNKGGTVTLNGTSSITGAMTGNAGSAIIMNDNSSVAGAVKIYGSLTLNHSAILSSTLSAYSGSAVLAFNNASFAGVFSYGSLTLNDTSSVKGTLTIYAGTTTITGDVSLITVTVSGGTVLFPESFPLTEGSYNTTYNVGINQALLDTHQGVVYFNKTTKTVGTKTPQESTLTSREITRIGTDNAWYAVLQDEGTADVDSNTWTFRDGTEDSHGTAYRFYGENITPITLTPGAKGILFTATIAPHESENAMFTYSYTKARMDILSGAADLTGNGTVYLDAQSSCYISSIANKAYYYIYPDLETIEGTDFASKIYYDGLLFTTGSPRTGSTNLLQLYRNSTVYTMTIGAGLANSVLAPAGDGIVSKTGIVCSAPNVTLTADVPSVTASAANFCIASNVSTLTMPNKVTAPVRILSGGNVTTVNVNSSYAASILTIEGTGHAGTITTSTANPVNAAGNIQLKDTSTVDTLIMQSGLYLALQQGSAITDLTLNTGTKGGATVKVYRSNDFAADPVYSVKAAAKNISGSAAADGSSTFTLELTGDTITVNGMEYTAIKDNAVVLINSRGYVSGDVTLPDISANLTVTSLLDTIDAADGVVTLREALAFSCENISWLTVTSDMIEAGTHALDPVTLLVVAKENMTAGKTYYRTGHYNGTAESISDAVIRFDSSLDDGSDSPAIITNSELVISANGAMINGAVGTKNITIDRHLFRYNSSFFETEGNFERFINSTVYNAANSVFNEIWTDLRTDKTVYGRVLSITSKVPVVLHGLTLTGGAINPGRVVSYGAAVDNKGFLTLVNTSLTGNIALSGNGGAINNNGGTVSMIGGFLEGNYTAAYGSIYSSGVNDSGKELLFDGITVIHNYCPNSVFLDVYEKGINISVRNSLFEENSGNLIRMAANLTGISADINFSGSRFFNNYKSGNFQIVNSAANFTDCVFDNSGYAVTVNSSVYSSFQLPVTAESGTRNIFTNCVFREFNIVAGQYSSNAGYSVDVTLNHCTVFGCDTGSSAYGIDTYYNSRTPGYVYTLNLELNDTVILGNGIDLLVDLPAASGQVNITANRSIIGYYVNKGNVVSFINNNSVIGTENCAVVNSAVEMVSYDPAADGFYEVKTAYINERKFELRGTSSLDPNKQVSVVGYHGGSASDLSMVQIAAQWEAWNTQPAKNNFYTTVTTLDDIADPTDGVISLREAIAYASKYIIWTAGTKEEFAAGSFGYDFSTASIIAAEDMESGKSYYKPTEYDGSRLSVECATIRFDSSLDDGSDSPTIILDSELTINTGNVVINGAVGTKNITMDRHLFRYNSDFFETEGNFERFISNTVYNKPNSVFNEIWTDLRSDTTIYGRVLSISSNTSVVLKGLTLTGGAVNPARESTDNGAGIRNSGTLTLVDTSLIGNVALAWHGGTIYNNAGTVRMIGGVLEGNYTAYNGTIYTIHTDDYNKEFYFEDIAVRHNYASNSSFIEVYERDITVKIVDSVFEENNGNLIHIEYAPAELNGHFFISGSRFINNFKTGHFQLSNSLAQFTDCVFDNSGYDNRINSFSYSSIYLMSTLPDQCISTFNNCVFREFNIVSGKYSAGIDHNIQINLNNCTVFGCEAGLNQYGIGTFGNYNYTLNINLNDTLILGNAADILIDLSAENGSVSITANRSIIGYFTCSDNNVTLINNDSVIGTENYSVVNGFIEMISEDPASNGYYEAKTAYINDRRFDLRGTSAMDPDKQVSIVGYHGGSASDLSMAELAEQWEVWNIQPAKNNFYTTVTTLADISDPTDGLISLREAIAYASQYITWTAGTKEEFAAGSFGYDFSASSIVAAKDMIAGKSYYKPDGYDGSRSSIESAMIVFDQSLTGDTITIQSELVISDTVVINGMLASGQGVIIDRCLVEYHADKWDITKIYGTPDFDYNAVWVYKGAVDSDGKPTETGRVMRIPYVVPVALANMTIQGGYNGGPGTGISSAANLTLDHVDIKGNYCATGAAGVALNMTNGTLRMYGGSIEGNASTGRGSINVGTVSSNEESLYFDGVSVQNNSVGNGCFIESYINGGEIVIHNAYVHDNEGNLFHGDGGSVNTNYTITGSLFENNFGYGALWFTTGIINIQNTVFDNSDYTYSDIYKSYPQYLSAASVTVYGGQPITTDITFENCLFNNFYVGLGLYATSNHYDLNAAFNHCTLTGCTDAGMSDWETIYTSSSSEDINITLNDTLVLGNINDFGNYNTTGGVVLNANNSMIGMLVDYQNNLTVNTVSSIVEQHEPGSVTFVQTTDPAAAGYYEAATATINGRTINLLGTSDDGKTVSVLGYHYGTAADLTMKQITDKFYTTVSTLADTSDPADGEVSLREAIAYIAAHGSSPITITFDPDLADTADKPTIELLSNLVASSPYIMIDGTLKDGKVVTIAKDQSVTDEVRLVNQGTLTLSNINLPAGLKVMSAEGNTKISGDVTIGYLAGSDENTSGTISVEQGSQLILSDFDSAGNESVYLIHHDTLSGTEITGDSLFISGKEGAIESYKIGSGGTVSTDLLSVVNSGFISILPEETPGIQVADILFFGNERLPVGTNGAAFTVMKAGSSPITVTDSFEWIYKGTGNTEVKGIKVKDGITLTSGAYTVSVHYGNLVKSIEFSVMLPAFVTLDHSSGTTTPRSSALTDLILTAGTANNFLNNPAYTVSWVSSEGSLNVSDYFRVDVNSSDPKSFNLMYKGGLSGRETAYTVRVTAAANGRSANADFTLTIITPGINLTPDQGDITVVTKRAELAVMTLTNFDPAPTNWTFELEEAIDTTHFQIDANNKLIYTGLDDLQHGNYSLIITADNGIDSADFEYKLTIKDCTLEVVSLFSSITTNTHDLNVARLNPKNFPTGNIQYTLSCADIVNIGDYFEVTNGNDGNSFIRYKSGLPVGIFDITVNAKCTASNPDDGKVDVNSYYQLTVTNPGVKASVVLDPTNRQMKVNEAVDGLQLASVELRAFEDVPAITVQAWNTTAKGESDEAVKKDYSDCFSVSGGKLFLTQSPLTQKLISGEYAVTVTATTYSLGHSVIQQASSDFILTLFDEIVKTDYTEITIDFVQNEDFEGFEVKETKDPENIISEGQANVLIVEIQSANTTPIITITQEAMKNLDAIHIDTLIENNIIIEKAEDPEPDVPVADHFIIDSAADIYADSPTAVSITANESKNETQIAKTISSGTKSIIISSTPGRETQYDINTLSTNIQINSNDDSSDKISFAGGQSQAGIVLNLDNAEYGQSVFTGQSGILTLNNTPGEIILSQGNDIVTGSSKGSIITDTSDTRNTIILNGADPDAENIVNLNAGATIIVNGDGSNNIIIENSSNTTLNLSKATGSCDMTVKGNYTSITGGSGKNVLNLTGNYAIVNSVNCTNDMIVNISGSNAIIKTGKGNDVIHVKGNNSIISSGEGNDIIYLEDNASGNTISTGEGDDIVISTSTGGNTIYTDGGNDFIIGGDGIDRIFGGAGFSLLAGGKGADIIIGGTGRDIMLANTSSKLEKKSIEELLAVRDQIFDAKPWWNNLDDALAVLGTSSLSDGEKDVLTRQSENGIDVFFRNLADGDTLSNALSGDRIFD
ncbi:MAG: hypothetical protein Q4G69_05715 [Planctomycetia bacterium]|nr:hypothetical protein [Planctomycetia bacterium]